jgi:hypothetical protein
MATAVGAGLFILWVADVRDESKAEVAAFLEHVRCSP